MKCNNTKRSNTREDQMHSNSTEVFYFSNALSYVTHFILGQMILKTVCQIYYWYLFSLKFWTIPTLLLVWNNTYLWLNKWIKTLHKFVSSVLFHQDFSESLWLILMYLITDVYFIILKNTVHYFYYFSVIFLKMFINF